jgi:hypothetical protein
MLRHDTGRTATARLADDTLRATPSPDDDAGFFAWLGANEDGYFLNAPEASFMLHGARCPHIDRSPNWRWMAKSKRCSTSRAALDRWVLGEGGTLVLCNECFS